MHALALATLTLIIAGQPGDEERVTKAKDAEERAFVAVDEERWCDASRLFIEANRYAPSVDLVFNAAHAAALAGDRKQAMKLYADLLGAYPGSKRQQEVTRAIADLTRKIEKEGPGQACPEPPPAEPAGAEPDPAAPAEPSPEPAPAPDPAVHAEQTSATPALWPWAVAGGGALLAVGGATLSGISLGPYFAHADAVEKIYAAEQAGADASALQKQQSEARQAWESWGELTLWSGVAIAGAGVAVTATGVVLGALSLAEPTEEETP